MFVCCECCVLSGRAYHSPRGVLPTVVCRCVWSRNHKNPREWGRDQGPLWGYRVKWENFSLEAREK